MSTKKKLFIFLALTFTMLTLVYTCIAIYFMNHFYPGTTINGMDASDYTVEEAQNGIQKRIDNYNLKITGRGDTQDSLSGTDIALSVEWNNEIPTFLKEQNGALWIVRIFGSKAHQLTVQTSYNEEKLQAKIDSFVCMQAENQVKPENAMLSEYSREDGYTIIPSVPGSSILREELVEAVRNSIDTVAAELKLDDTSCYAQPEILDDNEELLATLAEMNRVASASITYQVGQSTQVLDASVFAPWLYLDESGKACLKEDEVQAYVKQLGKTYNTCYTAKNFMTSYGREVKISNSKYGWKVDPAAEKAAIIEEITGGQNVTRDLHYSMTANSHEGNDYGNSYVEINYTAQHLFMYVDGELIVESDFVSGNTSKGNGSPTGAFALTYRDKDAVLNGADYSTPVTYWMPFAGNVGMHDATWRKEFGATLYKRNGSHGCINLPKAKAKIIFENIRKGFPVLCYELEGTQTEEGIANDQAYVVMDAITAITKQGPVTLDSEAAIVAARTQYDALSDMAKKYVKNYKKLLQAEMALEALK